MNDLHPLDYEQRETKQRSGSWGLVACVMAVAVAIAPPLLYVVMGAMKGVHGTVQPAIVLFPFPLMLLLVHDGQYIPLAVIITACGQFPFYGLILSIGIRKRRLAHAISVVLIPHVLSLVACELLYAWVG